MAMLKQERSNSNWEAMLKRWSVDQRNHHRGRSYTSVYDHPILWDGTDPSSAPPQWRGKAKEWYKTHEPPKYYYVCDRVYSISCSFHKVAAPESDSDSDSEEEKEKEKEKELEWMERDRLSRLTDLDELQEYAEFTDIVSVLHSEDCLFSFLGDALSYKHACIRAKIAEVVTTMVQNYPTSQQLLIKDKVLQLLLNNFTSDPDETSRTKTLGAISSLIRNNKSGITAFRREKGYAALRKALVSGSTVCQREVVNLIEHLLHENNLYSQELNLASSDDTEVREAALSGLLLLARRKRKNSGQLVKNDDKLKQVLQEPPAAALPIVQSSSSSTFPMLKKKRKKRSISSSKRMKLH